MILEEFISYLNTYLIGSSQNDSNIIRKHTKKLETLGDISLPLDIKNWHHLLDSGNDICGSNIFDYLHSVKPLESHVKELQDASKYWNICISNLNIVDNDLSIFLCRNSVFTHTIPNVIKLGIRYGANKILNHKIDVSIEGNDHKNLTQLRLSILYTTLNNFISQCVDENATEQYTIHLSTKTNGNSPHILCGPILNKQGIKDMTTTSDELFEERKNDLIESALHRFHLNIKNTKDWQEFFEKLGHAGVTIEMLSVKPSKAMKLSLTDSTTANKGPAFIFYNCARISVLFKEFQRRVEDQTYPELPDIETVDFSLLNQVEEWELLYVYVLQYPLVIKSCIKDIAKGIFNPQNLVQFLSNLSSLYSTYYRRVRILIDPRKHLFAQLHARLYLLRAVETVFHNALYLLNIEPIKKM